MKKFIQFILLVCCCIVFTGCGGNSNSYDGAYRITVDKAIINGNNASLRMAEASGTVDVTLKYNGVEFPGHSFDSDGNYIFTKVMSGEDIAQMTSRQPSIIEISSGLIHTIKFQVLDPLPQKIVISMNNQGGIKMYGSNGVIDVYFYDDDKQDGYYKVKDISLKKENSLTAKVTFYNSLGKTIPINYNSWKITASNSKGNSVTWTSEQNSSDIIINECDNGDDEAYYTITLSSKGEGIVGSHSLDDTSVRIDEIKDSEGKSVLTDELLSKAHLP